MKRFLEAILFILLGAMLSVYVSAGEISVSPNRDAIKNYDEIFELMYTAIEEGQGGVDLDGYKLSAENVVKIYGDIINAVPEFFYLENSIQYYYHSSGVNHYVTRVLFKYKYTGKTLENAKTRYNQELAYIVSLFDEDMSEAEKALAVHDYLISSFEYDSSLAYFDVYSLFTKRRGVCQAYSLAYAAILRELGMEAVMVTSEEMNHAWNLVKVDGEWYHADLSYDDPAPERPGHVNHDNFLLSDAGIANTEDPHTGWISTVSCAEEDYAGAFRQDVTSAMVHLGGRWYYIDNERAALVSSDFDGGNLLEVYAFRDKWYVDGSSTTYWVGIYSGVSKFMKYIFVNTPDKVIVCSPTTGNINTFLETDEGKRIFGSWIYQNTLEYMISSSPMVDETTSTGTFEITNFSIEEAASPLPFDDVLRIDDYYSAVKYVYDHGLFNGVSSTKFAPDATLTRAMYVTVLGRLCGVDTSLYTVSAFDDVAEGMWYTPYVEWASEIGLVNGVGGGRFDPNGEITREQMIKITAGLGAYLGAGVDEETEILYTDRERISDWARESMEYGAANGLIENSGELVPQAKASRAEAAVIVAKLARLCDI